MPPLVVLDVSFLHGASKEALRDLFERYEVGIIETLFFELLDSSPEERALRFKKLPSMENPGPLLPTVGEYLRFESREASPATPIDKLAISKEYRFHDRLRELDARFRAQEQAGLRHWRKECGLLVDDFREAASCVTGWFPDLKGYRAGEDPERLTPYFEEVAKDPDVVRGVYEQIRPKDFPDGARIGPDWVLFRHTQVRLYGALEHLRRYGDGGLGPVGKKTFNQTLDLDYALLGVLAGGLATRETFWKGCFRALRPDGTLIE